jgi:TolA-binding protein
MKRSDGLSRRELDELMGRARIVRPLPDVVRARARARARAAAAAATPGPAMTAPARGRRPQIAWAAALALVLGAAGAVAAIGVRRHDPAGPAPLSSAVTAPRSRLEAPEVAMLSRATPEPKPPAKPRRATRPMTAQESYAAELGLLQRAQVAYAERDLSGALVLLAEHARRFPNGRLAEEREALRIRSLARSGHTDEAQRATGAFASRFPRSVLLPRLRQTAGPD